MAEQMLAYIKEQPEVWERILGQQDEICSDFQKFAKELEVDQLVLIGSGSSYIASLTAAEFAVRTAGIACEVYTPAQIKRCRIANNKNRTLVVASSQSGKSVSTMNAVRSMQADGYRVVGMTADAGSPVALLTGAHRLIPCGEETVGPKTKGMTATILMLELLILAAAVSAKKLDAAQAEEIRGGFKRGIVAAKVNLEHSEQYFRRHINRFHNHVNVVVIADPESELAAREGALKLLETWYIPAYSYEMEEYTHGIQNTIEAGICNLFVITEPENQPDMERLAAYCNSKGCDDWIISTVSGIRTDANLLELEKGGAVYTTPFEILPAFQYLSAFGAEDRGINCDKPKFNDFYEFMNTKSI